MNITLRKAKAVQEAIQEQIRSVEITTSIQINEFQIIETELDEANNKLVENDARRQKLLLALYNIRGLVGSANAQAGIDLALAKAAFIDKRISQLNDIAQCKPVTEMNVLAGKLSKIRSQDPDKRSIYGRDETVSTSVVSKEQIAQANVEIKNLKKQKQKLNDEILELNIKTEIPLSDDVVNTLQAEGII